MKLKAFAKINLGLDVIGRREDGYHQVRMIMQTIRMFDQLEIEKSSTPGIRLSVNLPYSGGGGHGRRQLGCRRRSCGRQPSL